MANRLASEGSAYLRQHAGNPVDWYPWGEVAHRAASQLDRPILLSVGYSACHWCHVMAHESFEDPATARVMNEGFVCIKVDREERPDVDRLYQGVVQLLGRGGGWPLTVFLTPDLRPFFGGTYFPPDDRFGMPAFRRVLASVLDAWRNRRDEVNHSAGELSQGLRSLMGAGLEGRPGELSQDDVAQAGERLARALDPENGGFGDAPKFPNPGALEALLRAWRRSGDDGLLGGALTALEKMASGGVFDQLGGGFHRYSVDAAWRVPHFEKMLYDNGQLLRLCSQAFLIRPGELLERAVATTVEWLGREMTSPAGGFFSSQDADSSGEEGAFFVWTPEEVEAAAGHELAPLLCRRFGVTERGNFEGGRSVLWLAEAVGGNAAAEVSRGRELLFLARQDRPRPGRDEKILAGWNGLAIAGLAMASRAFARPEWAQRARRAADFVLGSMRNRDRLWRSWCDGQARIDGMLEDYGDFRASAHDGEQLIVPIFSVGDDAWPSGASTLCEALVLITAITGDSGRLRIVQRFLERLRDPMVSSPLAFGRLWCAAATLLDGAPSLAVAGSAQAARALLEDANHRWAPTLAIAWSESGPETNGLLRAAFEGKTAPVGRAVAYLCR